MNAGAHIENLAKRLHDLADEMLGPKYEPVLFRAQNREGGQNSAVDFQKIQSAEIEVPVIYATVLAYKPGELGYATEFARYGGRVYYTPEAVSDPEFLETVRRAPFSVATHEKNSSEANRDIDGWPTESWYDETQNCAMVKGLILGADNVEYAKQNKTAARFGSSADLSFLKLEVVSGVTPDGQEYDAKVVKLCCNHVAILPNIRDPKNTIRAINATHIPNGEKNIEKALTDGVVQARARASTANGRNNVAEENKLDKGELKNALEEIEKEKSANARHEEMSKSMTSLSARMAEIEKKFEGGGTPAGTTNEDHEKKEKEPDADNALNALNAMPAQETVAAFSKHFGIDFGGKTPSFPVLGRLIGAEGKPFGEIITAVNAKRAEIEGAQAPVEGAQNSGGKLLPGDFLSKLG